MAKEYSRSRGRMRPASSARRDDLADWRQLTRPVILENLLNRTGDLRWSRELIDVVLDELHVGDEFDDLIGRIPPAAQVNYPQLVALAVALRHSWFPEDLARIIADLGLSPSAIPTTADRSRSFEVIDTAKPRGFGEHPAASPRTCTSQKGEQQTC